MPRTVYIIYSRSLPSPQEAFASAGAFPAGSFLAFAAVLFDLAGDALAIPDLLRHLHSRGAIGIGGRRLFHPFRREGTSLFKIRVRRGELLRLHHPHPRQTAGEHERGLGLGGEDDPLVLREIALRIVLRVVPRPVRVEFPDERALRVRPDAHRVREPRARDHRLRLRALCGGALGQEAHAFLQDFPGARLSVLPAGGERAANRIALETHGLEDALEDINRSGVRLAREVGFEHIIAVVAVAPDEALREQVDVLLSENPDAFLLAGSAENDELNQALSVMRELTALPVIAASANADILMSDVTGDGGETKRGQFSFSPDEDKKRTAPLSSPSHHGPLMVCFTPDVPEGSNERQRAHTHQKAADDLFNLALQAQALGVQFIGTAPGSSPVFTGAISAAVGGLDVKSKEGSL